MFKFEGERTFTFGSNPSDPSKKSTVILRITTTPVTKKKASKISAGLIAGVVIVTLLIIIALVCLFIWCKKNRTSGKLRRSFHKKKNKDSCVKLMLPKNESIYNAPDQVNNDTTQDGVYLDPVEVFKNKRDPNYDYPEMTKLKLKKEKSEYDKPGEQKHIYADVNDKTIKHEYVDPDLMMKRRDDVNDGYTPLDIKNMTYAPYQRPSLTLSKEGLDSDLLTKEFGDPPVTPKYFELEKIIEDNKDDENDDLPGEDVAV